MTATRAVSTCGRAETTIVYAEATEAKDTHMGTGRIRRHGRPIRHVLPMSPPRCFDPRHSL